MNISIISTPTFETWDWLTPSTTGIGGSETSHIEMALRLAQRGHNVHSYTPTAWEGVRWHDRVRWERCNMVDWQRPNTLWIVYRDPRIADILPPNAPAWLICQDVDYPLLTQTRAERFTRIVSLCNAHAKFLKQNHPTVADRVCISSNGIRKHLIERTLRDNPSVRNPRRLMYASSPDRGLWILLYVFERAREIVPDLELHVFYGFQNINVALEKDPTLSCGEHKQEIEKLLDQPGVVHHGRVPQPQLAVEWAKSGIWCHPTMWPETSCITSMDAQALGAIPVTNPLWALDDNVQHGVLIDGDPYRDLLTRAFYVDEVARMALDPERQERIRQEMMPWALNRFDWETEVDRWEMWGHTDMHMSLEDAVREEGVCA